MLWMDVGTASKNNRHYINLSTIHKELGPHVCAALPAFQAFTGSDYTSSFARKGKIKPFRILEKHPIYQNAFKALADSNIASDTTKQSIMVSMSAGARNFIRHMDQIKIVKTCLQI